MNINKLINTDALVSITKVSGYKKVVMKEVCNEFGIHALIDNADELGFDNKIKYILGNIKNLIECDNMVEAISALTEIPVKSFHKFNIKNDADVFELLDHPEMMDLDARKFDALIQVKNLNDSYLKYQDAIAYLNEVTENHDYELDI